MISDDGIASKNETYKHIENHPIHLSESVEQSILLKLPFWHLGLICVSEPDLLGSVGCALKVSHRLEIERKMN